MSVDKEKIDSLSRVWTNKVQTIGDDKHYKDAKSEEAIAFLLKNMDQIKFVLCTHKMKNRYENVIEYMGSNFEYFDIKSVNKILFRNGIYSRDVLFILEILISIFLTLLVFIILFIINLSIVAIFFITIFVVLPFFGILCDYIQNIKNTKFVNYRLAKQYKKLPIPTKKIQLK